jgi:hypothetical protein
MEVQGGKVAVGPLWKPSWRTRTSCLIFVLERRWSGGYDISLVFDFAGSQAEQAMAKGEKKK